MFIYCRYTGDYIRNFEENNIKAGGAVEVPILQIEVALFIQYPPLCRHQVRVLIGPGP
jgi:hypothetical protein